MRADIYWIEPFHPGRLGTMARPRGGDWLEGEVLAWRQADVDIIASALTDEEMHELDLLDEASLCKKHGIEFHQFPIEDRGLPSSLPEWATYIRSLKSSLDDDKTVVAHCRMGIGRASMIAASIMVACGVDVDEAFQSISEARGHPVPDTDEQRSWIHGFSRFIQT